MARVRVGHGMAGQNYCVVGGTINLPAYFLYFRTMHVFIFILFKPNHALFLKHIHISISIFPVL